uniref:Heterokaryon incompatibility domain-containing protein n=1 Tax=Bionectria ochroleuca TaxID=29856 RepID=A0A8H7N615_BIOOC
MSLFNTKTCQLDSFQGDETPPFVVLSHNYGPQGSLHSQEHKWLPICSWFLQLAKIIADLGIHYIWEASVCVDSSSSAALEEAVNSSARRLRRCAFCIVFLQDLPIDGPDFDASSWRKSSYWTKASALPEFVLPLDVRFYDQQLKYRGSKSSPELLHLISSASRVAPQVLRDSSVLYDTALGLRISWAANRSAAREEDVIYALVPILGITLQIRQGEGAQNAFIRLQEEIFRNTTDGSIMAWLSKPTSQKIRGFYAHSPSEFLNFITASGNNTDPPRWVGPFPWPGQVSFSNKGAHIQAPSLKGERFSLIGICSSPGKPNPAIRLREWNGSYVRVMAHENFVIGHNLTQQSFVVARDIGPQLSARIASQFAYQDVHGTATGNLPSPLLEHQLCPQPPHLTYRPRVNPLDDASGPQTYCQGLPQPGMKRPRPGRSDSTSDSYESDSSDEDSSDSYDSDSDSDARSEAYTEDGDESVPAPYRLGPQHEFQAERPGLLDECHAKFMDWKALARYAKPAQDRLPPRKRARPMDSDIEDGLDQEDPDLVILSRHNKGFFHLSCPFFEHNREKYRSCVMNHDLQSIGAVINHLKEHHTQPPYCPICRRPFERCMERDIHVRGRTCRLGEFGPVDGVNERQKRLLKKRDKLSLGESERWRRIWETVFPDESPPRSAYLKRGIGKVMSLVQDCWEQHGTNWVEEYLEKNNKLSNNRTDEEDMAVDALSALTLQDLKERLANSKALSDA